MKKIKDFLLDNFLIIICLIIFYSIYNEDYSILLYLLILYVIFLIGTWVVPVLRNPTTLRSLQLNDLKLFLTSAALIRVYWVIIIIGIFYFVSPILFYGEKKEKVINKIVGDKSKIYTYQHGVNLGISNADGEGVLFLFTLPNSSTISDTIFTNRTKEEILNKFIKNLSDKEISEIKKYDITFQFLYYNASDYLVNEINVNPNEDL